MKNRGLSGSGMFLIELLLAILIFALASAVCLKVFVTAHQVSMQSNELNHAVVAAQNGAECFKASSGILSDAAKLLGGELYDDTLRLYFDDAWQSVPESVSDYVLNVKRVSLASGTIVGEVSVSDKAGDLIFSIPVSVMEVTP